MNALRLRFPLRALSSASKPGQLLNQFLHGRPPADRSGVFDDERSTHSKRLARGKYVHELCAHDVKPEAMVDYIGLVSEHFPRIASDADNHVKLVGSWKTIIGDLDQIVHMWEYDGYQGFHNTLNRLQKNSEHQEFLRRIAPMIRRREHQICLEFAFWLTSPPRTQGGVYELRSYQIKSGTLMEWETYWKRGLECRKKYCQPVGAWFTQIGQLNTVHHMWAYKDLETRKKTRESAWQEQGWAETVWNTVPLVEHMQSRILVPLDFSPLK